MNTHTIQNAHALMDSLNPAGQPTVVFAQRSEKHIENSGKHVGILDASFNPLTCAHEALAHYAQKAFNFDEQIFLLAKANVDKDLFGANLAQRLAMLMAYAGKNASVAGCSHARFVDKAQALTSALPNDTQIYFLMGHDTLIRIFDPRYYTDMAAELHALFSLCHIVSANRADQNEEAFETFMSRPECAPFANRVHPLHLPASFGNISSTDVRKRIQNDQPIDDLVPRKIARCIETWELYQT